MKGESIVQSAVGLLLISASLYLLFRRERVVQYFLASFDRQVQQTQGGVAASIVAGVVLAIVGVYLLIHGDRLGRLPVGLLPLLLSSILIIGCRSVAQLGVRFAESVPHTASYIAILRTILVSAGLLVGLAGIGLFSSVIASLRR